MRFLKVLVRSCVYFFFPSRAWDCPNVGTEHLDLVEFGDLGKVPATRTGCEIRVSCSSACILWTSFGKRDMTALVILFRGKKYAGRSPQKRSSFFTTNDRNGKESQTSWPGAFGLESGVESYDGNSPRFFFIRICSASYDLHTPPRHHSCPTTAPHTYNVQPAALSSYEAVQLEKDHTIGCYHGIQKSAASKDSIRPPFAWLVERARQEDFKLGTRRTRRKSKRPRPHLPATGSQAIRAVGESPQRDDDLADPASKETEDFPRTFRKLSEDF